MVVYRENPAEATRLINAIESQLAAERAAKSDGRPHVSSVIYCLRKGWRQRMAGEHPESYSKWVVSPEEENSRLVLLIGQALHSVLSKANDRRAEVRLECDWLVGEADARYFNGAIHEYKTCRAGMKEDDPTHFPHYLEQIASYLVLCREMGLPTNHAVLHVLHITFNDAPRWYEPHPKQKKKESDDEYAQRLYDLRTEKRIEWEQKMAEWLEEKGKHSNLRSWPLEYSDDELDRWRDELVRRVSILTGPDEPGVDECAPANGFSGLSWECTYCPYAVKNGGDCPGGPGRPASFFPADRED